MRKYIGSHLALIALLSLAARAGAQVAPALLPAADAKGICIDTPLHLTFSAPPTLGPGRIEIHNAADDSLFDSINITIPAPPARASVSTIPGLPTATRSIGGTPNFNYYPVFITGNQAVITPPRPLAANQSYYITIQPGLFKIGADSFAGITDKSWRFTTKQAAAIAAGDVPTRLTVAADNSGDVATIQAAIDLIPVNNTRPTTVFIKPGTYNEMIIFTNKHNITLLGQDRKETILQYPDNANFNPGGNPYHRGMFLAQRCNDLTIANMTFHNTTPQGGSQAEAFILNGAANSHAIVTNVDMFSYQDTLQINGQAYISDTYIEGDVDFMWGSGPCFFENSTAKALRKNAYFTQIRNRNNHGYVYDHCTFDAAANMTGNYIGRIDPGPYPASEVVLLDCVFPKVSTGNGPALSAVGDAAWLFNNATATTNLTGIHYWEFNSHDADGKPLDTSKRNPASKQLDAKTDEATIANYRNPTWVLGGNWTPKLAPIIAAQPTMTPINSGDLLRVSAVGVPTPTYQWQKDGKDIPDATKPTLVVPNSTDGSYRVVVKNSAGEATSEPLASRAPAPKPAAAIPNRIRFIGPVDFTPAAPIDDTLATLFGRETAAVTTTFIAAPSIAGASPGLSATTSPKAPMTTAMEPWPRYLVMPCFNTVETLDGIETFIAAPAAPAAAIAPTIVNQPTAIDAIENSNPCFTVIPDATLPAKYQWLKDGKEIPGATAYTLRLHKVQPADDGDYTVTISNAAGAVTSKPAALKVYAASAKTPPALPTIPDAIFTVADHGAMADGITDNTKAIQQTIAAAIAAGGGTVEIPPAAKPYLCGPITLGNKINLQIDAGATLQVLPYAADGKTPAYPNTGARYTDFLTASNARDVEISGQGTIEGNGNAWWTAFRANANMPHRPYMVRLSNCTNVLLTNIHLANSPMFHAALSNITNLTVFGIFINAPVNAPNTDGLDPSGQHQLFQRCTVSVDDDNIAIKAGGAFCTDLTVADCTFGRGHGVSIGGQSNRGLDGLVVKNCTFNGTTSGLRMKADPTQGGNVQNCTFTDLTMTNVQYPIVFYSYYKNVGNPGAVGGNQTTIDKVKTWNTTPPQALNTNTMPTWKNITIDHLTATGANGYSIIYGLPREGYFIDNVTLHDVSIKGTANFVHGLEIYDATNIHLTGTTTPESLGKIIVCNALAITRQPVNQSAAAGATATFTADAAGGSGAATTATTSPTPTVQWNFNGKPLADGKLPDGATVAGATTPTLTLTGITAAEAGPYTAAFSTNLDTFNLQTNALAPAATKSTATTEAATLTLK